MISVWPHAAEDWGNLVLAIFTAVAILIAASLGYLRFGWFRTTKPHAVVSLHVSHRRVGTNFVHLAVDVSVSNTSKVLLQFRDGFIDLFRVSPSTDAEVRSRVQELEQYRDSRWAPLGRHPQVWTAQAFTVEPGETDERTYEFIIDSTVRSILIDAYFYNERVAKHEPNRNPRHTPRRKRWLILEVKGPRVWGKSTIYRFRRSKYAR